MRLKIVLRYIFIHGLGQSPSNWEKTVSYLDQSIQVNCPDLFALCKDQKKSYQNLYKAFKEFCDEISGPINLCGISLGAIIAMNYAINHPRKVKSLVLIAPQYKMPRILLKIQNTIFFFISKSYFKQFGIQKTDIIQLTNSMVDLDFSDNLNNITCPTLIICGTKDYANKKATKSLAHNLLNASAHFIVNTGHEVNVKAPKALATILNSFYSKR